MTEASSARSDAAAPSGTRSVRAKVGLSVAIVIGLASLTTIGAWSAWTATSTNANNTFSTNTVLIADSQGGEGGSAASTGRAMFNVTNLEPGSSATTACIAVDLSGNAPASSLELAATLGGAGQSVLQDQLSVTAAEYNTGGRATVTPGSDTNNGSCAGYPAGGANRAIGRQGATLAAWAGGGPYAISNPAATTWYKFTVSGLPAGDSSCATYCNKSITVTLAWTLTTT